MKIKNLGCSDAELMGFARTSLVLLTGFALAGCLHQSSGKGHAAAPASARPQRASPRLECSFASGDSTIYRTYTVRAHSLVEQGPPRVRFKILTDDGETITAEHRTPGSGATSTVVINLRQHEASISEATQGEAPASPLQGTCAEAQ